MGEGTRSEGEGTCSGPSQRHQWRVVRSVTLERGCFAGSVSSVASEASSLPCTSMVDKFLVGIYACYYAKHHYLASQAATRDFSCHLLSCAFCLRNLYTRGFPNLPFCFSLLNLPAWFSSTPPQDTSFLVLELSKVGICFPVSSCAMISLPPTIAPDAS